MPEHYEQLIHEHEKLLMANLRLEQQLQAEREQTRRLRAAVANAGIHLSDALEQLRAAAVVG